MSFIIYNQALGKPECPYLRRWVINFGLFSIRLHKWIRGDDPRHLHDHPWNFITIVLSGNYTDITETGEEPLSRWSIRYRAALHKHTVKTTGCWTLLLTGPEKRVWGFWITRRTGHPYWVRASRYFRKKGHHPCNSSWQTIEYNYCPLLYENDSTWWRSRRRWL